MHLSGIYIFEIYSFLRAKKSCKKYFQIPAATFGGEGILWRVKGLFLAFMSRKKMTLIWCIYIRVPVLSGRKYGLSGLVTSRKYCCHNRIYFEESDLLPGLSGEGRFWLERKFLFHPR